jgi:hypothetical protein
MKDTNSSFCAADLGFCQRSNQGTKPRLLKITLIYVSWYRFIFKRRGLVPWLDLWQNPKSAAQKELFVSFIFVLLAYVLGIDRLFFPEPTSLILSLIGLLMMIQSLYVLLSVSVLSDN